MTANATWIQNPAFRPRLQAAVQEGVNAYMLIFSRALREQLSKPGTGRVYRVSQGKARGRNLREQGFHRASVPGRPPAADTGMLRRSWQIGENSLRGPKPSGLAGAVSALVRSVRQRAKFGRGKTSSAVVFAFNRGHAVGYRFGSAVHYARIEFGYGRAKARPTSSRRLPRPATYSARRWKRPCADSHRLEVEPCKPCWPHYGRNYRRLPGPVNL